MKLDIILRTCDRELRNENKIKRIAEKPELMERCIGSLLDSVADWGGDCKVHTVDDHSENPIKCGSFHAIEETGNAESLKYCYELAVKEGRELIYFVEDDWLHFPTAISEMVEDWQTFQSKMQMPVAIHPYDDPDRYDRDNSNLMSAIVRGKTRHYRTNQYSTQTFLIHKTTFFQHWTIWMDSIVEKKLGIHDANITNQVWRKGVVLFSPIPSLAIHMIGDNPEIYQDWKSLWEKYIK
jgi:hypothetical protein